MVTPSQRCSDVTSPLSVCVWVCCVLTYISPVFPIPNAQGLSQRWLSVSGGTTCTVVVILDSHKCYVANVGDSDCLACSKPLGPCKGTETPHALNVFDEHLFHRPAPAAATTEENDSEDSRTGSEKKKKKTSETTTTTTTTTTTSSSSSSSSDSSTKTAATAAVVKKSQGIAGIPFVHLVECTAEHSAEKMRCVTVSLRFSNWTENCYCFIVHLIVETAQPCLSVMVS